MIKSMELDIPLFAPGKEAPVHAAMSVDEDGSVVMKFEHFEAAWRLIELVRVNNLLGVEFVFKTLRDTPTTETALPEVVVYNGRSVNKIGKHSADDPEWLVRAVEGHPEYIYFYVGLPEE